MRFQEGVELALGRLGARARKPADRRVVHRHFGVGQAQASLGEQGIGLLVTAVLDPERRQVGRGFPLTGVQLSNALIARLGLGVPAELAVRLAEVVVRVGEIRAFLQSAFKTAQGLIRLLRLAVGDAQRIQIVRVAPVQLQRALGLFDGVHAPRAAHRDDGEHVPGFGVARVESDDALQERLGHCVVARIRGASGRFHQRAQLLKMRVHRCGWSLKVLALSEAPAEELARQPEGNPVKKNVLALSVASALSIFAAQQARAAGFALYEQGISGMGNAYAGAAAAAEDATTVWWNPAGMSRLPKGMHASVGVAAIAPSWKFHDNGSTIGTLSNPTKTGTGGDAGDTAYVPSGFFVMDFGDRLNFGLGISVPFGLKTEYDPNWIGRFQGIKSEVQTVNVNPAV